MPDLIMSPTVLIVDDAPDIQDMLQQCFAFAGYSTLTAANGLFALEFCELFPIAVIILDINMPQMDGIAFVHELERRKLRHCPIIVLTASLSETMRERVSSINAEAMFIKPCKLPALMDMVKRLTVVALS